MFFRKFSSILHIFLAEHVYFLTNSGYVAPYLAIILLQSKEKQADF